ncbi:MAG: NUDIX hydrolase [Nitrospirae bacterium]|nr:NUDIX hydrolase [Nitrospirota bacterium]
MKVINKKILWEGRYLRAVLVEYLDGRLEAESPEPPAGIVTRTWETIERVGCSGIVVIVPFTGDGSVILIRQFRPAVDAYVIELPAGLVDPGEKPEDAARRELIEETGYRAGDLDFMISGPASSGSSSEILDVFVASGLSFVGIGNRDESENIEVIEVPLERLSDTINEMQQAGNFIDLKVHGMIRLAKDFLDKKSA